MSITERIEQLREAQRLEEQRAREETKKKEEEIAAKYWKELPEARRQQASLLEELRQAGVVAMIEEIVESQIKPLRNLGEKYNYEPLSAEQIESLRRQKESMTLEEQEAERKRIREVFRPKEWIADIPLPTFSEEGLWDTTLTIKIIHNFGMVGMKPFPVAEELKHAPFVSVSYRHAQGLVISGAEKAYHGRIPTDDKSLDEIETALARAIVNPKRPEPPRVPEFHNVPVGQALTV